MTVINDTYKTIEVAHGDVQFKDKGSKFIGYVFPISNEDQIKMYIDGLKKKHHAARHWCYAWQLGIEEIRYRVNDDGEPNNTAGQPIYGQILANNITNVLIVVVRYFGGTKLGVGGLINAYRSTAKLLLEESEIVEKTMVVNFQIIFDYKDMDKVMRIVKRNNLKILKQKMELNCNFIISVRKNNFPMIEKQYLDLRCLKIKRIQP
ncbi:IMPACT family protein [Lutibacter sp.]